VGACGVGCMQVQIKTDTMKQKLRKMRRPTNTDSEYRMEKGTMSRRKGAGAGGVGRTSSTSEMLMWAAMTLVGSTSPTCCFMSSRQANF